MDEGSEHTSNATEHTSNATEHTSNATEHTSNATEHTSNATEHTSNATEHTSNATEHTSNATEALEAASSEVAEAEDISHKPVLGAKRTFVGATLSSTDKEMKSKVLKTESRECAQCHRTLSLSEFSKKQLQKDNRARNECRKNCIRCKNCAQQVRRVVCVVMYPLFKPCWPFWYTILYHAAAGTPAETS
jgi:hypothetical protein